MNNIFPVHILYHPKIQKYFPSLTNQPHGDAYNTPNFKAHLLVGGGVMYRKPSFQGTYIKPIETVVSVFDGYSSVGVLTPDLAVSFLPF